MSLNFNLTAIEDNDSLCWIEDGKDADGNPRHVINPVTQAIIFHMMTVVMDGVITDANHEEVFKRIWIVEEVYGASLRMSPDQERRITYEDVRAHIGLKTNAFTSGGKRRFKDNICAHLFERAGRVLKKEKNEKKIGVQAMGEAVGHGR